MPCAYHHTRGKPVTHGDSDCRFGVSDDALVAFADETWCPFHLPLSDGPDTYSSKAQWDMETTAAFGAAVLAYIDLAIENHDVADLAGLHMPGDVSFEPFADPETPFPAVSFEDAHFGGDADFIETRFSRAVSFREAVFDGDADFIVAAFEAAADFSGAVFKSGFDAAEARFRGGADFSNAVFLGPAIFRETQFAGPLDFTGAQFKVPPVFEQAALPEGALLDPALLKG